MSGKFDILLKKVSLKEEHKQKETHRKAGVFNMPLYRIVPPGGAVIGGEFIPAGVEVSTCNYAVHRNKETFGQDVETFRPERFIEDKSLEANLLHFSQGHRSCLGRK